MRIALVSDTHGRFDPRLPGLLAGCDLVLHAGDVVGRSILEGLEAIAPVHAVRGNNDRDALGRELPEVAVVRLGDLKALVIHELGKPAKLLPAARRAIEREDPQLVIYGHSHKPAIELLDGRLFVNPGSAGPRRFKLPRSVGLLSIRNKTARVELLDLEETPGAPLPGPLEVDFGGAVADLGTGDDGGGGDRRRRVGRHRGTPAD